MAKKMKNADDADNNLTASHQVWLPKKKG